MRYLFVLLLIVGCGQSTSGESSEDSTGKEESLEESINKEVSSEESTVKEATIIVSDSDDSGKMKQPRCEDMDGLEITQWDDVPNDYTGVAFECENGKVRQHLNVKDGKPDGFWRLWHDNGQLRDEKPYKNGVGDGVLRRWYENGQLEREWNFKDGKEDGVHRSWHENGQLMAEMNWKEGKEEEGKVIIYDKDGTIQGIKCFSDGREVDCE